MLIQCENCRTIFSLEETLLKAGGSRVRCSRCGHIFMAYPSVSREKDMVEDAPAASTQAETEVMDQLILIGDEEEPRVVAGKDEAFEADLQSAYRDGLVEPGPDLEKRRDETLEETGGEEKTIAGEQERATLDNDIEPPGKTAPKKKSSRGGLRTVLLAILLALLGGAAAMSYWKPELIQPYLSFELIQPYLSLLKTPEKEKPADAGVRLLQFESVAGSFVDSDKSRQLFVIRGMVHSQYPKPRSYILIKGSILDNRGKVVKSRSAYAGNTFTEEELKTLPIEEVLKAMENRDGMARQNFNVPSGASIPFMIVFDNLPDTLSEFAVEAVSSSPGI
jgi:predicted Zn finger-like uncharacterized protein